MANRISGAALFLSCLGFLPLFHSCSGQITDLGGSVRRQQRHPLRFRSECRLENLHVLEPSRRIEAEAGYTELWDEKEEALTCTGSAFTRHVIRRNGLFLPSYSNPAELMYVVQGRGLYGVTVPGCPETYQSEFRGRQGTSEMEGVKRFFGDRHQKGYLDGTTGSRSSFMSWKQSGEAKLLKEPNVKTLVTNRAWSTF